MGVTLAEYLTDDCIKVQGLLYDSFYKIPALDELDKKILDTLVSTKFPVTILWIGGNRKLYQFLKIHKAEKIL
jgi:hypothetical protein